MVRTFNPATGESLATYPLDPPDKVEQLILASTDSFARWKRTAPAERAARIGRLGDVPRDRQEAMSRLITLEMGKPIAQARAEVARCAEACAFFASHGPTLVEPRPVATEARWSGVRFEPIGPVLAIMPWNFPVWQLIRAAVPALIAGNTVLLKHAATVTGCGAAIADAFDAAGLGGGVFGRLVIDDAATEAAIGHPAIAGVTLTGSTRAGRSVARAAGERLKPCVLELGGSDPFIVLPGPRDWLERTATRAAEARCLNTGQSCIAAKRFIIVGGADQADAFARAMASAMNAMPMGDGLDERNRLGPLARADLRELLASQVKQSVAAGARPIPTGHQTPASGFFHPPLVLADVPRCPDCPAWSEELFGPVATVVAARDADEAVALANDTRYGLGASVWSPDRDAATELVARLDAGAVFINDTVKSDLRLPFGGTKASGLGRELAEWGARAFTNIKTVWIA